MHQEHKLSFLIQKNPVYHTKPAEGKTCTKFMLFFSSARVWNFTVATARHSTERKNILALLNITLSIHFYRLAYICQNIYCRVCWGFFLLLFKDQSGLSFKLAYRKWKKGDALCVMYGFLWCRYISLSHTVRVSAALFNWINSVLTFNVSVCLQWSEWMRVKMKGMIGIMYKHWLLDVLP